MNMKYRFSAPFALAAALALPVFTNGCGAVNSLGNPTSGLCCTDFKVGADLSGADFGVDASIKGQFKVFAQAAGDLSAVATSSLDDVTNACHAIATAGGKNADKEQQAASRTTKERVDFWCDLAEARIKAAFSAAGSIKVHAQAPKCEASVKATANCQANCDVKGGCDVNANPPKCEGGKLEVSCSGGCQAEAPGASIACEGGCTGKCEGSCSAEGGVAVDCEGKCEGTCEGAGGAGTNGIQADGTCKGKCKGTCTMKAGVKATCSGSCKGSCDAKCEAKVKGGSVKCDGKCDAKAEPISCKGGTLKASCEVDAKCDANCNASAQAKAECTPPTVNVAVAGNVNAEVNAVVEALKVNLPKILVVFQARGKSFIDMTGDVSASASAVVDPGKLGVKGTACLGAIVPVIAAAADNMTAAFQASGKVAGSVGMK